MGVRISCGEYYHSSVWDGFSWVAVCSCVALRMRGVINGGGGYTDVPVFAYVPGVTYLYISMQGSPFYPKAPEDYLSGPFLCLLNNKAPTCYVRALSTAKVCFLNNFRSMVNAYRYGVGSNHSDIHHSRPCMHHHPGYDSLLMM